MNNEVCRSISLLPNGYYYIEGLPYISGVSKDMFSSSILTDFKFITWSRSSVRLGRLLSMKLILGLRSLGTLLSLGSVRLTNTSFDRYVA